MPVAADAHTAQAMATLAVPVHQAVAHTRDAPVAYAERIWALFHLQDVVRKAPEGLEAEVVPVLGRLLQEPRLGTKRQDLFLARKAAEVLVSLAGVPRPDLARGAWSALMETLAVTRGLAHRGTAETLGSLPCLDARVPQSPAPAPGGGGPVPWDKIVQRAGLGASLRIQRQGRSLLAGNGNGGRPLVVKMARADQDPLELAREAAWMESLAGQQQCFGCRFEIPEPLRFDGGHLVRPTGLPRAAPDGDMLHPEGWAIAYLAPADYFVYPNDPLSGRLPEPEAFIEIMGRAALLFGALAAAGIIHEAPIPLFHNRVQRHRRRDAGRYEWFRGGRLDRWLASCAYPNWGPTGLRDFEHLIAFTGPPLHFYRHLGNHFLSLLLVAGSYFRARDSRRVGQQPNGEPVDARDLFDADLLTRVIEEVFRGYRRGFVGRSGEEAMPLDAGALAARMVEEMGVDRHMAEILRATDQAAMTRADFESFLRRRGFPASRIETLRQGEGDLAVPTGPHLGGFNRTISLPELITAVETMAAACVAGRYRLRKAGKAGESGMTIEGGVN
jgi:hypothetical protein